VERTAIDVKRCKEWERKLLLLLLLLVLVLLILLHSLGAPDHRFVAILHSIAAIEKIVRLQAGMGFGCTPHLEGLLVCQVNAERVRVALAAVGHKGGPHADVEDAWEAGLEREEARLDRLERLGAVPRYFSPLLTVCLGWRRAAAAHPLAPTAQNSDRGQRAGCLPRKGCKRQQWKCRSCCVTCSR
jgi:hypothetical protein